MPRWFAPLFLVFAGFPVFAQSGGQAHVPRPPYPQEWEARAAGNVRLLLDARTGLEHAT